MSAPEMIAALHELEAYGLVFTAVDDNEIEDALSELSLCEPEDEQ